jgi:hypothetical protein
MNVTVNGRQFVASYFPFFRVKKSQDFDEWGIRFADGSTSDVTVLVFDQENSVPELYENAKWLINEFILEEDDALTPRAQKLKQNLMEIFHEQH